MLLLCVDSSSQAATAALLKDGAILCEYTQNQNKTHSIKMLPMIERMLSDVEVCLSDIDIFACGIGPGSFTGVRIGVATVRGFAKTLEKETVSVNSLEILANNVADFAGRVYALVFARENECYLAAFENGKEILSPCVMCIEDIIKEAEGKTCLFVGDGADINQEKLSAALPGARFATGRNNMISAASAAEVAHQKVLAGKTGTSETLVPLYLRKSQAEREYEARNNKKIQSE